MSMIRFIYISLQLLCMLMMYLSAIPISRTKTDRDYWRLSTIPIFVFSFVHGLRFAREQDYLGYFFHFTLMGKGDNPEDYEYLFFKICHLFGILGIPFWILVLCTAILFITSVMFVMKDFRRGLPFVFLFLFWEIRFFDYWMRYYIAFPFFLFAFGFLLRKRYLLAIVFSILAFNIHIGLIMFVPVIVFYKFIDRINISPMFASIVFVLVMFLGTTSWLLDLTRYLTVFDYLGVERVDFYTSSADDLLEGSFLTGYFNERSWSNNVRTVLAYLPGLLFGKKIIEQFRLGNYIYNMFAIGAMFHGIFTMVEILDRIDTVFMFFSSIVNGLFFYHVFKEKKNVKPVVLGLSYLCLFSAFWPNLSGLNKRPKDDYMLFIWDADGRDYIGSNDVPMTGNGK